MNEEVEKAEAGTDYFRSYYKNYVLAETIGADGIARNEFIYNGKVYGLGISEGRFVLLKLVHSLLFGITLCGIVVSNLLPVSFNLSKAAAVPMFALIFLMVLRLFALSFYWLSPVTMREWDHKHGPKRLRDTSLLCAAACSVLFAVYLVLMFVTGEFSAEAVGLLLAQIPSGAAAFAAYQIEKRQNYTK